MRMSANNAVAFPVENFLTNAYIRPIQEVVEALPAGSS